MLILSLYATYDRLSKTLGEPFLAANDEVAREKLKNSIKIMRERKEAKFNEDNLTVLNLGYYRATMIENKDNRGIVRSYEPNIFYNDKIYDINDVFEDVEIRTEKLLEMRFDIKEGE